MGIADKFKNPWVLGGGVLIGAVILLSRGSGGGSGNGGNSVNPVLAYNAYASQLTTANAQIALASQAEANKTNITLALGALSTLANLNQVDQQAAVQNNAVSAGIFKSLVSSATTVQLARAQSDQAITTQLIQQGTSEYQTLVGGQYAKDTAIQVAGINANAAVTQAYIAGVTGVAKANASKPPAIATELNAAGNFIGNAGRAVSNFY